ncbi:SDR family oxidoreductase [Mesorhizobium sp. KR9-304]|uniref:SDR family NAD(P)-dependent oxidoreductase n=1 Tax=Mesorhizobium sp. KR9-304 TaxID=3156614 RepID=UPI0032B491D0
MNKRQPILDVDESTYERIMAVNLRGLYQLSQAIVPMMPASGGKIVNIGSINSEIGLAHVSVYGATKGAVKQLTKVMAVEWASRNIQVNCIIPGFMRTPLSAAVWADEKKRRWMSERIALQRPGEPEELLGMAIYLSSKASSYVTGQAIIIDGGVTAGGAGWA